jgi:hypothetical protein
LSRYETLGDGKKGKSDGQTKSESFILGRELGG